MHARASRQIATNCDGGAPALAESGRTGRHPFARRPCPSLAQCASGPLLVDYMYNCLGPTAFRVATKRDVRVLSEYIIYAATSDTCSPGSPPPPRRVEMMGTCCSTPVDLVHLFPSFLVALPRASPSPAW